MLTLREFIKKNYITNAELAKALGVSPQMVSHWVNDSRIFVDEDTGKLLRISVVRDNITEVIKR